MQQWVALKERRDTRTSSNTERQGTAPEGAKLAVAFKKDRHPLFVRTEVQHQIASVSIDVVYGGNRERALSVIKSLAQRYSAGE
eukprot:8345898-Alexandrium_andersonii.AAC.1